MYLIKKIDKKLKGVKMKNYKYLQISAKPRYWEDAIINGKNDINGVIPFRNNDVWEIIIDIANGKVIDWKDIDAKIYYKVCDEGEYFILDKNKNKILKYNSDYVPDILSINDEGFGDYIIMNINKDGFIEDFKMYLKEKGLK